MNAHFGSAKTMKNCYRVRLELPGHKSVNTYNQVRVLHTTMLGTFRGKKDGKILLSQSSSLNFEFVVLTHYVFKYKEAKTM